MGAEMVFAVSGYAVCSSLMLIINKVTVRLLPIPSTVLLCQLLTSAVATWTLGFFEVIQVDALEWRKVKPFLPVAAAFVSGIYCNIKTLQYANVETFIVFRASTPLLLSVCDWLFLGRELPSRRSWAALVVIVLGAGGYVRNDSWFDPNGYFWVGVWYANFCFDQIYIKHVCDSVKMDSNWGRVYYTNLLSSCPLLLHAVVAEYRSYLPQAFTAAPAAVDDRRAGGPPVSDAIALTRGAVAALVVSCAMGVAMSYFAFKTRNLVSATAFAVIGNACKILSVAINVAIWDQHANALGVAWLLMCLAAAYFYKPAPLRSERDGPSAGKGAPSTASAADSAASRA